MTAPFEAPAFLAEFLSLFKAEAEEHLAALATGLVRLEREPHQPAVVQELFRQAHTLKGGAGMVGCAAVEQEAHRLEDFFEQVQAQPERLTAAAVTQALAAVDGMRRSLAQFGAAGPAPEEYIRVPLSRVNLLLNLVGELVISRVKSSYKLTLLRRLHTRVAGLRRHVALLMDRVPDAPARDAADTAQLRELVHAGQVEVERLTQQVRELVEHLSSETVQLDPVIDELQFKMKKLRMLPCATIFTGLAQTVRDIALAERKQAAVVIEGEETELDKKVLEALKPCLIHLVRNAVFHGIERPEDRAQVGKPPVGTVRLRVSQQSGLVVIEIQDDGRGIDVERVTQAALQRGLVTPEALGRMGPAERLGLIFAPGLSTSPLVTDVAGRGVGLDVVRQAIEGLRGRVQVLSQPCEGTTLRIELPLTVAILQVLLVEVEGHRFGVPLSGVEETVRVSPQQLRTVEGRMAADVHDALMPVVRLADVLQVPPRPRDEDAPPPASRTSWPVVVASSFERRVGLLVDRVLGEEEIFIKSLGGHLGKVLHVSGATVLGTGEVMPVLDLADVLASASLAHPAIQPSEAPTPRSPRRILLVEDSLTTRELERSLLEAHGYVVETAVDGLDAMEKLAQAPVHLVISDVEMPRMNGLELCAMLRQRAEYRELPVIFVTSCEQDAERCRGIEVGAQAYLVKSAFDQTRLLQTIERLIG